MKTIIIDGIEYNLTPKVLFKKGDWVVYDHRPYQVVELPKEGYINLGLKGNGKIEFAPSTYCKHWAIQDAKDGDVLVASDKSLFIYDGSINENGSVGFHIAFTEDMDIILNSDDGCGWEEKDSCHPATKEQRDLLFQKMKKAGYEWDAEKKELKKIEQKPAWSEEDEAVLDALIRRLKGEDVYVSPHLAAECLKSLKDRVQSQSTWKPSDEQMEALHDLNLIGGISYTGQGQTLIELYNDLKKLIEE